MLSREKVPEGPSVFHDKRLFRKGCPTRSVFVNTWQFLSFTFQGRVFVSRTLNFGAKASSWWWGRICFVFHTSWCGLHI